MQIENNQEKKQKQFATEIIPKIHSQNLNFCWGIGNELFLFGGSTSAFYCPKKQRKEINSQENNIYILSWDTTNNESISKFLSQTHSIFVKLQMKQNQLSNTDTLEASQGYRIALQNLKQNLIKQLDESNEDFQLNLDLANSVNPKAFKDEIESEAKLVDIMERVFHLCENFFLLHSKYPSFSFVRWFQLNFTDQLEIESIDTESIKWNKICRSIIHGKFENAINLLAKFPPNQTIQNTQKILQEFPELKYQTHLTIYRKQFQNWRKKCDKIYNSNEEIKQNPNLSAIYKILLGDENEINQRTDSWIERFASKLLFIYPNLEIQSFGSKAKECFTEKEKKERINDLDQIYLDILSLNTSRALLRIYSQIGNTWLSAHLSDLLFHIDSIQKDVLPTLGTDIREFFVLEFCQTLLSNPSRMPILVDYLISCQKMGKMLLSEIVQRQNIDDEFIYKKLLNICQNNQLDLEYKTICQIYGMKSFSSHKFPSGINALLEAEKIEIVNSGINRFFKKIVSEEIPLYQIQLVIESLESDKQNQTSKKVLFLKHYKELCEYFQENQMDKAGRLILEIMKKEIAPKMFWLTLIWDAIVIMEEEEKKIEQEQFQKNSIFNHDSIMFFLTKVKEITSSHQANEYTQYISKDQLQVIRFNLIRALPIRIGLK
ncbi:frount protein-related [Anaeramoeba ignava]|uniref:Nuclear pore complex protein Nup85 n=1 Tax=Anaeramoeba ignava TaxID=1746090 RepID=A0A9Q0RHT1_ANAIG|nr:frount protein-related [Anaeramoeba ignava]